MQSKKVKRWIKITYPNTGSRRAVIKPEKVDAWVIPGIQHLFVNRRWQGKGFVVSHRPSGLRLSIPYIFETRRGALLLMQEVNAYADWSQDGKTIKNHNPIIY